MPADPNSPIRILIVDDHEMVRVGLKSLLDEAPEFKVVGEAGNLAEAMAANDRHLPDLILLDIGLPDGNGLEACRRIRAGTNSAVKVLVFSGSQAPGFIVEAIAAGAQGFLLKGSTSNEVLEAVRAIAEGKSILDPNLTPQVFASLREAAPDIRSKIGQLSRQERRVIAQVAEGKTNKEIGSELGLSDKTVKNYLSNAMDKLEIHRRSEAAAFYARHLSE